MQSLQPVPGGRGGQVVPCPSATRRRTRRNDNHDQLGQIGPCPHTGTGETLSGIVTESPGELQGETL